MSTARLAALLGMLAEEPAHPPASDRKAGLYLPRLDVRPRTPADALDRLGPFAARPGSPGAMQAPGLLGVLLDPEGVAIAGDGSRFAVLPVEGVRRRRLLDLDAGVPLDRPYPDPRPTIDATDEKLARPVRARTLRLIAEIALAARAARTWNPPAMVRIDAPPAAVRIDSPGRTCMMHATALVAESEGHYVEAGPRTVINDYAANHELPASYYDPKHVVDALRGSPPLVGLRMLKEANAPLVVCWRDGERHVLHPLHPVVLTVKEHSPA